MSRRRRTPESLRTREAVALGALHGPAELLPVSSSGHITLVPWLLRWSYSELDAELRKAFEVAVHAGTAAALLIALRDEVGEAVGQFDGRRAVLIAGSFVPPAGRGLVLVRARGEGLGRPAPIAVGFVVGAAAHGPAG